MAEVALTVRADAKGAISQINELRKTFAGLALVSISVNQGLETVKKGINGLLSVVSAFKSTFDLGSQLSDLRTQTGESVRNLVLLRQAFQNAGLGADALGRVAPRLSRAISGLTEEGKSNKRAFDALGLSMEQLRNMTLTEQITAISGAFSMISNPTDRAALAVQLFGRSGAEMLTLFSETDPLKRAEAEVGGLADAMESSAVVFDSISDKLQTISGKGVEFLAGALQSLAPAIDGVVDGLSKINFAQIGQQLGSVVTLLTRFRGIIIGVGAAVLLLNLRLGVLAATSGTALGTSIKSSIVSFKLFIANVNAAKASGIGFGQIFKAQFASIATSAKAAGIAIKGALVSTGIGALIAGLGIAVEAAFSWATAWNDIADEQERAFAENFKFIQQINRESANIASETEKLALQQRINDEIAQQQEKIVELSKTQGLQKDQLEEKRRIYELNIQSLEIEKRKVAAITQEQLEAAGAARVRSQLEQELADRALKIREELPKLQESLQRTIRDDQLAQLSTIEKKTQLLREASVESLEQLNEELYLLSQKGTLTDVEVIRMSELIGLKTQLVGIEREITKETAKRSEETSKISQRISLLNAEAQAIATGNAEILEREKERARLEELIAQAAAAGLQNPQAAANAQLDAENNLAAVKRIQSLKDSTAELREQLNPLTKAQELQREINKLQAESVGLSGDELRAAQEKENVLRSLLSVEQQKTAEEAAKQALQARQDGFNRQNAESEQQLSDIRTQRQRAEQALGLTQRQRSQASLQFIAQERAAMSSLINEMISQRELLTSSGVSGVESEVEAINKKIEALKRESEQLDFNAQQIQLQSTFGGQLQAQMAGLYDQMALTAGNAAGILTSTLGSAIQGVSQALTDAIMGAKSFEEAMQKMVKAVIQQLIQMVLQALIATAVITALNAVTGGGASGAMAGLGAAKSLIGGFAEGGLIPGAPSRADNRIARVASGEYVVRTDAVRHYGAGLFEALNNLKLPRPSLSGLRVPTPSLAAGFALGGLVGTSERGSGQLPVNVAVLNTRQDTKEYMRNDGRHFVVDTVSGRSWEQGA